MKSSTAETASSGNSFKTAATSAGSASNPGGASNATGDSIPGVTSNATGASIPGGDSNSGDNYGRLSAGQRPRMAWLPFVGLLLLVFGVYANSLRVPFLLDDWLTLVMEPTTHSWSNAARSAYGRRVGMLSFAANHAWGRTEVFGYHLVNLAIHLAAGSLLWALCRRLLRAPGTSAELARAAEPLAWTIAALWLVHPLQTNAVTYTVQRFESLASLGILAALYAVARQAANWNDNTDLATRDGGSSGTGRIGMSGENAATTVSEIGWGVIAIVCGWLATQSKEISIGLPILAVALSRAFFTDSWRTVWRRQWWVHAGLAAASAMLLYQTRSAFVAGPAASAGFSVAGLTSWQYLRSQPAVILYYLRLAVWPDPLCLDYGWPVSNSPLMIYGLGAVILGMLAWTGYACFRSPRLGFPGLAFFTVLGPTSSFVPIADLAFEHRMYLPLAPVAVFVTLAGWRLVSLCRQVTKRSASVQDGSTGAGDVFAWRFGGGPALFVAALVAAVVGGLSFRTVTRNRELANPELLWRQAIAINPSHVRPRVHYIGQLIAKGDLDGAIRAGHEALKLGPHAAELHSQMGTVFMKKGQTAEAERCFRLATEADPNFPMSWFNWATLCFQQSRHAEASRLYRRALDVHSVHVESWSGLGWSLELMGETREAAACYRRALALDPSLIVVTTRLADLLATTVDDSLRAPAEALRMMEPLAKRTRGRNPYILDSLAAALAANGRNTEAVRVAQAALKLSPEKSLRARLEVRLAAYQAGKPIASGPKDAIPAKVLDASQPSGRATGGS